VEAAGSKDSKDLVVCAQRRNAKQYTLTRATEEVIRTGLFSHVARLSRQVILDCGRPVPSHSAVYSTRLKCPTTELYVYCVAFEMISPSHLHQTRQDTQERTHASTNLHTIRHMHMQLRTGLRSSYR
jgi:hypothetical protein